MTAHRKAEFHLFTDSKWNICCISLTQREQLHFPRNSICLWQLSVVSGMTNSPIEVRAESADFQDDVKKNLSILKKKGCGRKATTLSFLSFYREIFLWCLFHNDKFKDLRRSAVITSSKHRQDIIIHIAKLPISPLFRHMMKLKTKFQRGTHTHTHKQVCELGENSVVSALFIFFLMQQNLKAQRFKSKDFFQTQNLYLSVCW